MACQRSVIDLLQLTTTSVCVNKFDQLGEYKVDQSMFYIVFRSAVIEKLLTLTLNYAVESHHLVGHHSHCPMRSWVLQLLLQLLAQEALERASYCTSTN